MNITIVAGSNRRMSTGTRLAVKLQEEMQRLGHHVCLVDLYRNPVPIYSPDQEEGDHAGLVAFKKRMFDADALVLVTPEYHGSMSGVMKNALDYLGKEHMAGKAVLSVSSSGGAVGISSLQHLQAVVRNLHGINCPEWLSIGGAQRIPFQSDTVLYDGTDAGIKDRISRALDTFLALAHRLRGTKGETAVG